MKKTNELFQKMKELSKKIIIYKVQFMKKKMN